MIRYIILAAALLLTSLPAPAAPLCWPSTVGGTGTQYWTHEIVPDAIDNAPAGTAAVAVWWHCPDPAAASGWQTVRLLCHRERLSECMDGLPRTLLPAALAAAWPASSPEALGLGWAWAIAWQDFAKATVPPPIRWIVAKAASNANPPGTRPSFPWVAGTRSTTSNGRAAQDTACDPRVGRIENSTAYYGVNGRTDQVAVCVRAP